MLISQQQTDRQSFKERIMKNHPHYQETSIFEVQINQASHKEIKYILT